MQHGIPQGKATNGARQKGADVILPLFAFAALDLWSLRNVLTTPGIVGHVWDWSLPVFPDQNLRQALSLFWSWDDAVGAGTFNPLKSLFYYFMIYPLGNLGGEFMSKALVLTLPLASALGMYLLVRKGLRLDRFWSFVAGVIYMLSPITYSRLISGYFGMLIAQALLPILILSCLRILSASSIRSRSLVWQVFAAGITLGVCQALHSSIFILAPVCVVVFLGFGVTRSNAVKTLVAAAAVALVALLLNISWITSFGINYFASGSLYHGGTTGKPSDQITLASVTDWRQGILDTVSQPIDQAIRLNAENGVATEIVYPVADAVGTAWLFASFLIPLSAFALLLSREGMTRAALSFFVLGLLGVALVSGTRTVAGTTLFDLMKRLAPPAWAEFGASTRAFPIVLLSYAALAPMALQRLSRTLAPLASQAWARRPRAAGLAPAAGVLTCVVLAVWSVPFLSGDITRSTDTIIGLHFYNVDSEDRALYDWLRADANDARMTLVPPPNIWGTSDYGWVWEAGNLSPRPKFLAPSYNPDIWRAATDYATFDPNSRAGALLGLAAVDKVVYPFARLFHGDARTMYDAVLGTEHDLVPVDTSFSENRIFQNQASLPRVYAAPTATTVLGSSDLLPPLSTTELMGKRPALFFSAQQSPDQVANLETQSSTVIAPVQMYTITASALMTASVGVEDTPDATAGPDAQSNPVYVATLPETSVQAAGSVSIRQPAKYIVRASAYAATEKQVADGQPAVATLASSVSESFGPPGWQAAVESSGIAATLGWESNTVYFRRVGDNGELEIGESFRDSTADAPYVQITPAVKPFRLDDYPVLQVNARVDDPGIQLIQVWLGLDWNGDGVADDNWLLPIVPAAESKASQFAIKDFVKLDYPNKPDYPVVGVTLRLTQRPNVDQQAIGRDLYNFSLSDVSFRSSDRPDALTLPLFPPPTTAPTGPQASLRPLSTLDAGLIFRFPAGANDSQARLRRSLASFAQGSLVSLSYRDDGPASFAISLQASGVDSAGEKRFVLLGTRTVQSYSSGVLVFDSLGMGLKQAQVDIIVTKMAGASELRATDVTLAHFAISSRTFVPFRDVSPSAPEITIDGKRLSLDPMPASADRSGSWFQSGPIDLGAGSHAITAGYGDPTTPFRIGMLELEPVGSTHPAAEDAPAAPAVTFRQINPTRYLVHVQNAAGPFFLVFSESFHAGWQASIQDDQVEQKWYEQSALLSWLFDSSTQRIVPQHDLVNGFANSWYLDKTGSYDVVLEFTPQRLYEAGVWISIATPVIAFAALGALELRKKSRRGG
ncbi:MAG: hypothetical protein M1570_02040 [Chloroflexi bacterium]|nr:hypothetical protein [Chloroflexota bacterium]